MEKKDQAIILHTRNYGESDRIVTLFLLKEGKRIGMAKGARASKKRFGASLEIGAVVELGYKEGGGKHWLFLNEAALLERNPAWRASWKTITIASYCLELAVKMLPEGEAVPQKFSTLKNFLAELKEPVLPTQLFDFEYHWLSLSGWEPDLKICAMCGKDFAASETQAIYDHYWHHILGKPLLSRKLLNEVLLG